jgi:hypothetical protein
MCGFGFLCEVRSGVKCWVKVTDLFALDESRRRRKQHHVEVMDMSFLYASTRLIGKRVKVRLVSQSESTTARSLSSARVLVSIFLLSRI